MGASHDSPPDLSPGARLSQHKTQCLLSVAVRRRLDALLIDPEHPLGEVCVVEELNQRDVLSFAGDHFL